MFYTVYCSDRFINKLLPTSPSTDKFLDITASTLYIAPYSPSASLKYTTTHGKNLIFAFLPDWNIIAFWKTKLLDGDLN